MGIDFDYFSLVIASVVRRIASDQLIIEQGFVPSKPSAKWPTPSFNLVLQRNRFNIELLSQLVFIGQNYSDMRGGVTSLIEAIESAAAGHNSSGLAIALDRRKPLIDVIAEQHIIASIIRIILILIKLEDQKIKKVALTIRRRSGYVSIRFVGGKVGNTNFFSGDVVEFINMILAGYGGRLEWRVKASGRVVFVRLHLSNQIPFSYNELV